MMAVSRAGGGWGSDFPTDSRILKKLLTISVGYLGEFGDCLSEIDNHPITSAHAVIGAYLPRGGRARPGSRDKSRSVKYIDICKA